MFCFRWNELPVDGDQWSAPGALGQQRARRQKQPAFDVSYSQRSELTTVEDTYMQVGDEVSLVTL